MEIMNIATAASTLDTNEKRVFISGVSGQDGSLMAEYLLKTTNYSIVGGARRLSTHNHINFEHLARFKNFYLVNFDLTDTHSIDQLINYIKPHYFINFAAQSFVKSSWDFPAQTWETNTTGVLHILESIRQYYPQCRMYNAGSSEEFGDVLYSPQDENHPMRPRSPYGASKSAARQLIKVYRDSYNLFAIQAWLFNHEGIRRGKEFVTRKISSKVAEIYKNILEGNLVVPIELGNLDVKRDWSDAEDLIEAVWLMLNNVSPEEYVVSSGECHSVREFVELAFLSVGIEGEWKGSGTDEVFLYVNGPMRLSGTVLIKINSDFYRPAEVNHLLGNNQKILSHLNWRPKTSFKTLVHKMVMNDLALINKNSPRIGE